MKWLPNGERYPQVGGRGRGLEAGKLEAAKKAKKRAESHLSRTSIVRRTHRTPTDLPENEHQCPLDKILLTTLTLATTEKLQKIELCNFIQKK